MLFGSKTDVYFEYIMFVGMNNTPVRLDCSQDDPYSQKGVNSLRWKTIYSYTIIRVINIREHVIVMGKSNLA